MQPGPRHTGTRPEALTAHGRHNADPGAFEAHALDSRARGRVGSPGREIRRAPWSSRDPLPPDLLATVTQALAGPPVLPVQGSVSDALGAPLDGTSVVIIRLYATEDLSDVPWSETHTVQFTHGAFSLGLGATTPLDLSRFADDAWLTITVDGAESDPFSLGYAPRAAWAHDAMHLGGQPADRYLLDDETIPFARITGDVDADRITGSLPFSQITGDVPFSRMTGDIDATRVTGDLPFSQVSGAVPWSRVDTSAAPAIISTGLSASSPLSLSGGTLTLPTAALTTTLATGTVPGLRLGTTTGDCSTVAEQGQLRWTGTVFQACTPQGWGTLRLAFDTPNGLSQHTPSSDCRKIHYDYPSQPDGVYWIETTTSAGPYKVWCDMTTDGGGWTLAVGNRGTNQADIYYDNTIDASLTVNYLNPAIAREYNGSATSQTTYTATGIVISRVRSDVSLTKVMFKHPSGTTYAHTGAATSLLALPANSVYTRSGAQFPDSAFGALGSLNSSQLYYKRNPSAGHRNFIWSKYEVNAFNQDGIWCWSGSFCGGTQFYGTTGGPGRSTCDRTRQTT